MRLAVLFFALVLTALQVPSGAQQAPAPDPAVQRWMAVFEQSYGAEGLYVVEVKPSDPAGPSRLNLQMLNAAAQQFRVQFPTEPLSFEALEAKGLAKGLLPPAPGERYIYVPEQRLFTSSLGGEHTPLAGALLLMAGNEAARSRLLRPDRFTRQRWKKIYADPQAPVFLRREIELREFLLERSRVPGEETLERVGDWLDRLGKAKDFYAAAQGLKAGATITPAQLQEAGLLPLERPRGWSVTLGKIGDPVLIGVGARTFRQGDPPPLEAARRAAAQEFLKKAPQYPPAMALAARYEEPAAGLKLLGDAIARWPDVAGLRVERLSLEARRKNYAAWSRDLDEVLRRFPAAPLLTEIQLAAEYDRISELPEAEARIALLLADVRPDLLTQQLFAFHVLARQGDVAAAATIRERLVYAHPGWGLVLPDPKSPSISPSPKP